MKIVFRVDASLVIGSGHVMRCLTLARALKERGHQCVFIGREHPGNLNARIENEGFEVYRLLMEASCDERLAHADWLGASQDIDAEICRDYLRLYKPDWLVVDHYSLDEQWEQKATPNNCRVLVIDDLADRAHRCDVLLDQNLGKEAHHYKGLVDENCIVLTGPRNALLRPEFSSFRAASLRRRMAGQISEVLISLGGVDINNITGAILTALRSCDLPTEVKVSVIMGATAPHIAEVCSTAKNSPWPVEVDWGVNNMAERMVRADLAIGAGGGTSWERCALGVPTLLVVLADNQLFASESLLASGAVDLIDSSLPLEKQLNSAISRLRSPQVLKTMSDAAAKVCDGGGVLNIVKILEANKC